MKTFILKTHLNQGEIERRILSRGYMFTSEKLLDQIRYLRSHHSVGLLDDTNGFVFTYRNRRWSKNAFPIVRLTVVPDKEVNYVRLQFTRSQLSRVVSSCIAGLMFALVFGSTFVQSGNHERTPIALLAFITAMLVPLLMLMMERHARKEVYYFISDMLRAT